MNKSQDYKEAAIFSYLILFIFSTKIISKGSFSPSESARLSL